jgi:hypothetical protein
MRGDPYTSVTLLDPCECTESSKLLRPANEVARFGESEDDEIQRCPTVLCQPPATVTLESSHGWTVLMSLITSYSLERIGMTPG